MIIIIDNYDSFTQNLVQYVGEYQFNIKIFRNDNINLNEINLLNPTHIILSPGPGNPCNTGISLEIIQNYVQKIPILGVCLGHQAIGYIYGAEISQLNTPIHGKTSEIFHDNNDLFDSLPNPFIATRYHSLIINKKNLPNNLEITAWTKDGLIMGCEHKSHKMLKGVQFHPESLWTNQGKNIIKNFLKLK